MKKSKVLKPPVFSGKRRGLSLHIIYLLAFVFILSCTPAYAAEVIVTNSVLGGLEGVNNDTLEGGDGAGSALVRLRVIFLSLNKQAHSLDGATEKMTADPLPNDAKIVTGQRLFFTLHVDNPTVADLYKLTMQDKLDESAFEYVEGSMQMATTEAGTPAKEDDFKTNLTDNIDSDVASFADIQNSPKGRDLFTLGEIPNQKNAIVSVQPGKRLTIRFKVIVK